jgi:hypothetical protein
MRIRLPALYKILAEKKGGITAYPRAKFTADLVRLMRSKENMGAGTFRPEPAVIEAKPSEKFQFPMGDRERSYYQALTFEPQGNPFAKAPPPKAEEPPRNPSGSKPVTEEQLERSRKEWEKFREQEVREGPEAKTPPRETLIGENLSPDDFKEFQKLQAARDRLDLDSVEASNAGRAMRALLQKSFKDKRKVNKIWEQYLKMEAKLRGTESALEEEEGPKAAPPKVTTETPEQKRARQKAELLKRRKGAPGGG